MRVLVRNWLLLMLLAPMPALATGLYRASVIVTGTDLRSRPGGLRQAFAQALVKASGNPAWLDDPRALAADPTPALRSIAYLDRESDLPKHDEQGTRDRPYDLVADFDAAAVDASLRSWGDSPWPQPRPLLVVDVAITPRDGPAMTLQADTDPDERHRAALMAAADRFDIAVAVPSRIAPLPQPPGSPVLRGTMVWSDADYGWVGRWQLILDGGNAGASWELRGVGFDAAYRDGVAGAVRRLSGH